MNYKKRNQYKHTALLVPDILFFVGTRKTTLGRGIKKEESRLKQRGKRASRTRRRDAASSHYSLFFLPSTFLSPRFPFSFPALALALALVNTRTALSVASSHRRYQVIITRIKPATMVSSRRASSDSPSPPRRLASKSPSTSATASPEPAGAYSVPSGPPPPKGIAVIVG